MFFITIVIPCRNEEKIIGKCLDSILAQDYSRDRMEVLVVDGASVDGTRVVVDGFVQRNFFIRILDNPRKIASFALNKGINEAKGEVVIRMDAHAQYPSDYVSKCVKYLNEYAVDNVGGVCLTLPGAETLKAKAITLALSTPFGVGNSYFRIGTKEPKIVDTVPFGCYRRGVFERIGNFNENLVRNQDIEFNLRLKKAGGKILLVPDIKSYYYARDNFRDLFRNNFENGFWVIYGMKFAKLPFSLRHLAPFSLVSLLILSAALLAVNQNFIFVFYLILGLYLLLNIVMSLSIAFKKGISYFLFVALSFFILHFSYGLGSICGLARLILPEGKK